MWTKYFTEGGDALPNAGRLREILDSKLKPVHVNDKNKICFLEIYFNENYEVFNIYFIV